MEKSIEKYQKKAGMPPGTLIHIGQKKSEETRITLFHYSENNFEEHELREIEECLPFRYKEGITWINIDGLHRVDVIEKAGNLFGIHNLVLEDIANTNQRPKAEIFESHLFVVLKMMRKNSEKDEFIAEQVSLIVGHDFVISFQEIEGDLFDPIRKRIRSPGSRLRKTGADYLAYAMLDIIVDNYFVTLDKIGEKIEDIEEVILENPAQETVQGIHSLKRDIIFMRRSLWPLREVTDFLLKEESGLIQKSTGIYIKDLSDHVIRVIDTIETSREMLSEMLDIYHSSISNRMGKIMEILTVISTIFIPLTFLAGVYGMNFLNMPELGWKYGYPAVILLMALTGTGRFIFFKKKKIL